MIRQRRWRNFALGRDQNSTILFELLVAADDPELAYKLVKRFAKVTTVFRALRRGIADRAQRAWLEQLVLRDTWRELEAKVPDEIAHRFYARLREAVHDVAP